MKIIVTLCLLLASAAAHAASVGSCDGLDSIGNLMENTKTFAQGTVKLAHISTEEPAVASDHLLVFLYGDEMSITCFSVNADNDRRGFKNIDLSKIGSFYDATKGLLLVVPVSVYNGGTQKDDSYTLKVRVDQKNTKVTMEK